MGKRNEFQYDKGPNTKHISENEKNSVNRKKEKGKLIYIPLILITLLVGISVFKVLNANSYETIVNILQNKSTSWKLVTYINGSILLMIINYGPIITILGVIQIILFLLEDIKTYKSYKK